MLQNIKFISVQTYSPEVIKKSDIPEDFLSQMGKFLAPSQTAIAQSSNLYIYCLQNPLRYVDYLGEFVVVIPVVAAVIPAWVGYAAGGAVAVGAGAAAGVYLAKGGKQNYRSNEFLGKSNEEIKQMYKNPNTSKKMKQKLKKEQKVRDERKSSKKKNSKKR